MIAGFMIDHNATIRPIRANDEVMSPNPVDADVLNRLGMRTIVLVGMMGAGKTTVGRRLAARLSIPFTDADVEIEAAAGQTIPEIFDQHGEDYFRAGERKVIARLLKTGPRVLATGGGAFMNRKTRENIARHAVSVWLKADFDTLMARVRRRSNRPLLKTADPDATMRALIETRYPVYGKADLVIGTRDVPHDVIVGEIIEAVHAHLAGTASKPAQKSGVLSQ